MGDGEFKREDRVVATRSVTAEVAEHGCLSRSGFEEERLTGKRDAELVG